LRWHVFGNRLSDIVCGGEISVEWGTETIHQTFENELTKLRAALAEKDASLDRINEELERAKSEVAALEGQKSQLEFVQKQTERLLSVQAEQIRQRVRNEFADLDARLNEKSELLQAAQSRITELQKNQDSRIEQLQLQLTENQLLLQTRNEELIRIKSELDRSRDHFTGLEVAARQAELAAAGEQERMRTEFQAQLALLQAELSQKEWALEEKHAVMNALEHRLNAQAENLQVPLSEKQAHSETRDGELFLLGEPGVSDSQKERTATIQSKEVSFEPEFEARHGENHSRRWRTGWAWKRRWKKSS
jgi:chromosome segregation ATPase